MSRGFLREERCCCGAKLRVVAPEGTLPGRFDLLVRDEWRPKC